MKSALQSKNRVIKDLAAPAVADRPYDFVISTSDPDRMGDIVDPKGVVLDNFQKNPIALWAHDYDDPIGTWSDIKAVGNKLIGTLKLAASGTSDKIDELRGLIEQGILRAVSIGFMPLEAEESRATKGMKFTKWELLEISLVAVPANQNAVRIKSLGLSDKAMKTFFTDSVSKPDDARQQAGAGKQGMAALEQTLKSQGKTMTLSTRIASQQKAIVAISDDLEAIETQLDNDNGNADLLAQHKAKSAELKGAQDYLEALKSREADAAERVIDPVADVRKAAPRFIPAPTKQKELAPGELIATKAAIDILANAKGMNKETVAATFFKGDKIADMIVKSSTQVGDTTTAGTYMELVQTDTRGLIEAMRPTSVAAALAGKGIVENFTGYNQILRPYETGDETGASWVGEVGHIPVSHAPVGRQTFDQYKLATVIPYSIELLDRSVVGLVDYLRRAIIMKFSKRLDDTLLSSLAAIPGVRPAGILAGVAVTTATGGAGQAALIGDIKALMSAASTANNINRPTLIMNEVDRLAVSMMVGISGEPLYADDLAAGRLGQLEVVSSTHVPSKTMVLVQAGNFLSAFDAPNFMVSREATLVMANANGTAPTHSIDSAGVALANAAAGLGDVLVDGGIPVKGGASGTGTAGALGLNMFQTYSEALRGVMPATYGFVRPSSVAHVASVTWA